MKKLIIVGCGPKAIAIAAKAHVLQKQGWTVPEIVIIDKHGPGANWDGTNGYTDGDTILGTTPLEDVGFPYASLIDDSVDEEMLKFSYMAYLVDIGKYAEWVDRGLYPPTHAMLADYLKWVVKKVSVAITIGEVTAISLKDDKWSVAYGDSSGAKEISGDSLVLTGPGDPHRFPRTENSLEEEKRIFNGQNIWPNIHLFKDMKNAKIAVIGAGETAAGIVTGLLNVIDGSSQIEIITRHPILFTRNENWMEVMYFSKVMNWSELSKREKTEIIRHADRGTFSVAAKNLLDSVYNVSMRLGNAEKIGTTDTKAHVMLSGNDEGREGQKAEYDYVIEATGFDPFSLADLFPDKSFLGDLQLMSEKMDQDLSVTGLSPKLHIPGLSAMAQGPGFPNLSCLGLLAERILIPYIDKD